MQYMGSKSKHAKDLLPIILKDHTPEMWYVEPFVGGANMIDKVDPVLAPKRLGCDFNEYLIHLWKAAEMGWMPPKSLTEEEYKHIKNNKESYPKELVAWVGFAISFGGKWFGGYSKNSKGDDYVARAYRSAEKQFPNLRGVKFLHKSVFDLDFSKVDRCTIYCDPPYVGTTGYKDAFNHDKFYNWCLERSKEGHDVFISEYSMPHSMFECIYSKNVTMKLSKDSNNDTRTEKLFVVRRTV